MMENSLVSPHRERDAMMRVVSTWGTCSQEEKEAALQSFLRYVELKIDNLVYGSNEDTRADLQVIKQINSLFLPQRMERDEQMYRALLDETRAVQGIFKIQGLMEDLLSSG